jgi:MFS family permease
MPASPADRPVRTGLVLTILCLAQFMLVLDISVTNVALASIRADLDFAVADLQWIVTSYTLVFGSLLIFFGRVGDLWGRRRLFVIGTAVFSVASLLCGLAQTPAQLIAARALQGLGGAMMSPAALSLLTSTFAEGAARNKALGVWGSIAAGGAAAGLIIGGVLTDVANWRWVFLINVPVGLVLAFAAPRVVPESRGEDRPALDVQGALTLTAALAALVYGLTAAAPDGASTATAVACLIAAAVLLAAFILVERRAAAPLFDFSILRSRSVSAANAFSILSTAVVVAQSFFISLYLRDVLGFSPLRTGLALVPSRSSSSRSPAASRAPCRGWECGPSWPWPGCSSPPAWCCSPGCRSTGSTCATCCPRSWSRPPASASASSPRPSRRPRAWPTVTRAWRPACSTPRSRSAARWDWRSSRRSRRPGPRAPWRTAPRQQALTDGFSAGFVASAVVALGAAAVALAAPGRSAAPPAPARDGGQPAADEALPAPVPAPVGPSAPVRRPHPAQSPSEGRCRRRSRLLTAPNDPSCPQPSTRGRSAFQAGLRRSP